MYRQPPASGRLASGNATTSNSSKQSGGGGASNESPPTTIREIRSRTLGSSATSSGNNARHLLNNKRQAMSMERLNGGSSSSASSVSSTLHGHDKEKSSPTSGSSNSINSSPSRTGSAGGLNRTASRVSRFRSAKAVFERLSNSNSTNSVSRLDKPSAPEKPRGTVASRYAAAAAARATTHSSSSTSSPRARQLASSLARSQDSGKSASNIEIHKSSFSSNTSSNLSQSSRSEANLPRPQPRVMPGRTVSSSGDNKRTGGSASSSSSSSNNGSKVPAPANKPPPKDLIDKIVLEIALDAGKQELDANCTIQDLSNCDISGIPETLDFDRCFQDVEMMTEEEARKLLSRKSPNSLVEIASKTTEQDESEKLNMRPEGATSEAGQANVEANIMITELANVASNSSDTSKAKEQLDSSADSTQSTTTIKCKVRFSEEPVQIYNTHAVEDYDRRNDDIDPVAASAEYEIEKSKEREGLRDSDDDDDDEDEEDSNNSQSITTNKSCNFTHHQQQQDSTNTFGTLHGTPQNPHAGVPHTNPHDPSANNNNKQDNNRVGGDTIEDRSNNLEYVESLERELALKRILEQNLRDLQSQYYEAVKELDDYKGQTETKLSELNANLREANETLESSRSELADAREESSKLEKQLDELKDSSQILEKKYHRAKRIIKDMQSREQSFNRREQLYQQKLDEIEFELGVLIESVDRTIHDDGIKFFSISDNQACQRAHQVKLDVFGLIRQMLNNFNANQSTQNPQIKQRVVSIIEQQLANLMLATNGNTAVSASLSMDSSLSTSLMPPIAPMARNISSDNSQQQQHDNGSGSGSNNTKFSQSYQLASHRLSQPNLPHPIGVGGQPTKLFHGLTPMPAPMSLNEPSPPQSVNSFPSTNSLNSISNNNNGNNNNNNNNNNTSNNNNNSTKNIIATKLREQPSISDLQLNMTSIAPSATDEKFQPALDIQVPYQTNEWHDKPVSEWTTTQVSTWLLALGLDQYISKFEDRNVNGQSLINLDSTVLKGLGVLNSNDRNLLKKKIRELRNDMEKERKQIEKKMKETLKDKSKNKINGSNKSDNKTDVQQTKPSWKRGLLS